jgi:copper(I)-binding protein
MRLAWLPVTAGTIVAAVGAAGLIRGAMAQAPAAASSTSAAGPIAVTNPYVWAPVPPSRTAAAYFTVYNTTGRDDRLLDVQTGAGTSAVLHLTQSNGSMVPIPNGVVVHAGSRLVLSVGKGHVMIEGVIGTLKPGQTVDLELDFQNAGPINVVAPVLPVGTTPGSR